MRQKRDAYSCSLCFDIAYSGVASVVRHTASVNLSPLPRGLARGKPRAESAGID